MYHPELHNLVGDEQGFLDNHFGRSSYVNAGALTGSVENILTLPDLDELLRLKVIRSPYLRISRDGASIREANFTCNLDVSNQLITDAIDAESVYSLLRGGATVTWNSLNHIRPNIRRLCSHLASRFNSPSDAIAFLTPASREGFAAHHDPVDVFVLQLAGTKTWKIWPTPVRRQPIPGHYTLEELGEPETVVSLGPGDVLYLPFGTPHVARSEESISLHLSITVEPRTVRSTLRSVVEELIDSDEASLEQLGPDAGSNPAYVQALRAASQMLAQRVAKLDAVSVLQMATTTTDLPPERGVIEELGALDRIALHTNIRLGRDVELSFPEPHDGRWRVTVRRIDHGYRAGAEVNALAESSITMPETLAAGLRRLSEGEATAAPVSHLMSGLSEAAGIDAARKLVRAGILEPCP